MMGQHGTLELVHAINVVLDAFEARPRDWEEAAAIICDVLEGRRKLEDVIDEVKDLAAG